jgi:hypothetical protein
VESARNKQPDKSKEELKARKEDFGRRRPAWVLKRTKGHEQEQAKQEKDLEARQLVGIEQLEGQADLRVRRNNLTTNRTAHPGFNKGSRTLYLRGRHGNI